MDSEILERLKIKDKQAINAALNQIHWRSLDNGSYTSTVFKEPNKSYSQAIQGNEEAKVGEEYLGEWKRVT